MQWNRGGVRALGKQTLELQHADMDQGFWNDTYSYGGWDWGRPVLWIVFSARVDTRVQTSKHTRTKEAAHTHIQF